MTTLIKKSLPQQFDRSKMANHLPPPCPIGRKPKNGQSLQGIDHFIVATS
ncbi:MAG: hypothetical protein HXX08_00150 [Chloroflexi bacterium]|uniref:Uncharacterized protein n=1 Tax=Candidatus Chlorohelix allophototropha TaxID=3003348 RepID=A0A8T7LQH3_9CHLR|nr:hypothetical protein [Chloroflexota bacterium]WJW66161.1 hypothetical protein OZ401_001950 [Chloroflexota bacterium L227-S17]